MRRKPPARLRRHPRRASAHLSCAGSRPCLVVTRMGDTAFADASAPTQMRGHARQQLGRKMRAGTPARLGAMDAALVVAAANRAATFVDRGGRFGVHAASVPQDHPALLQLTLTSTNEPACGSVTCTAQARHGSKLWMVRRISSGCLGSAITWPLSAAS